MNLPYTPRALQGLKLSQDFARMRNYNYVGTEHLLLGVCTVFVEWKKVKLQELYDTVKPVDKILIVGDYIPYTPRVKKCLNLADKWAKSKSQHYVDVQALLVGILEEAKNNLDGNDATRILASLDVDWEAEYEELSEQAPNTNTNEVIKADNEGEITIEQTPGRKIKSVEQGTISKSTSTYELGGGFGGSQEATKYVKFTFTDGSTFTVNS